MRNVLYRLIPLAGGLLLSLGLAGCAKPRTGPFDVPAAMLSSGTVQRADTVGRAAPDVDQAAMWINAAKIHFDFDRSEIRPDARAVLDQVAILLKRHPSIRIGIQGHCDERGSREYNFDLGERRARAAHTYLVNAGVPRSQMDMVTHGKMTPAVLGRSESAWAINRRVEFNVLTTCYTP